MQRDKAQCPTHGEYMAVIAETRNNGTVTQPCPTCMAEKHRADLNQLHREMAEAKKRNTHRSLAQMLGHSGIPERFIRRGFDNYEIRNLGQQTAMEIAKRYALSFGEFRKQGRGLIFIGPTGTGKSHLAISIAKVVIRDGYSAAYATTKDILDAVKETFGRNSEASERQVIDRFAAVDLLVMDEVGVQYDTDAERVILTALLDKRYRNMQPTIVLSNHNIPQIEQMLSVRVGSRLAETCDVVECVWEDWRKAA